MINGFWSWEIGTAKFENVNIFIAEMRKIVISKRFLIMKIRLHFVRKKGREICLRGKWNTIKCLTFEKVFLFLN